MPLRAYFLIYAQGQMEGVMLDALTAKGFEVAFHSHDKDRCTRAVSSSGLYDNVLSHITYWRSGPPLGVCQQPRKGRVSVGHRAARLNHRKRQQADIEAAKAMGV